MVTIPKGGGSGILIFFDSRGACLYTWTALADTLTLKFKYAS
jgi:hypothetical protein